MQESNSRESLMLTWLKERSAGITLAYIFSLSVCQCHFSHHTYFRLMTVEKETAAQLSLISGTRETCLLHVGRRLACFPLIGRLYIFKHLLQYLRIWGLNPLHVSEYFFFKWAAAAPSAEVDLRFTWIWSRAFGSLFTRMWHTCTV